MNSNKAKKVSSLQKHLQQHKDKFQTLENGKIKCLVTGHQFMPTVQNFQSHLQSKSFKKASQALFDISKYEKILQTHKENKNFLFCRLTGAKIPKKKTAIQKHINCKKYQKRYQQYIQKMGGVQQDIQKVQYADQQQDEEEQVHLQQEDLGQEISDQQENQQSQESKQVKTKNNKKNGKNGKHQNGNGKGKGKGKNKKINKKNNLENNKNNNNKKKDLKDIKKRK